MEGILVLSYGSRAVCTVDSFLNSDNEVRLFIADKQANPFNVKAAEDTGGKHVVIPDLDVHKILDFAEKYKNQIDFGFVGPEGPIIDGVRDLIEENTEIRMVCPTGADAIEKSKADQRKLIEEVAPDANPEYQVFHPEVYKGSRRDIKTDLFSFTAKFNNRVAIKPVKPGFGKGVAVWGDHFTSGKDMFENYFLSNFKKSPVIVEEKVEGEEFSVQFISDGKHLVPTPAVRDYKRAWDEDTGPNTGGMGSYKDTGNVLPFMRRSDWDKAVEMGQKVHEGLKKRASEEGREAGTRGIPEYMAYICTEDGVKCLEINSRPGDPEWMNVLPILKNDFVDVCYKILDGNLRNLDFNPKATVVTYATPLDYGGYIEKYSGPRKVDLTAAEEFRKEHADSLKAYPGSMKGSYALNSRTIAAVGIADSIEDARRLSRGYIMKIDGPLRHRENIGSETHIELSKNHMNSLRG
ncbi:MAG: hypothetical protein JSV92_03945 [archaeon]|nr:MAG: hypothetical protein JSV92_03945 [archaeon]